MNAIPWEPADVSEQQPEALTGRDAVAQMVIADRSRKYRTVDAARIAAGISRGSWEQVERGAKVRPYTLARVEEALGWPPGRAQRIIDGTEHSHFYRVPGDFREWVKGTDILSEAQRRELLAKMDELRASLPQAARDANDPKRLPPMTEE